MTQVKLLYCFSIMCRLPGGSLGITYSLGLYRAVIELNGLCAANYAVTVTWHRTYPKCSDKIHGRPSSFTPTFIKRNCATTQLLVLYIHALPVLTLPS